MSRWNAEEKSLGHPQTFQKFVFQECGLSPNADCANIDDRQCIWDDTCAGSGMPPACIQLVESFTAIQAVC